MFHTNNCTAMSRRAIALLTAAVTLSSIALIGVPAATADEQQALPNRTRLPNHP